MLNCVGAKRRPKKKNSILKSSPATEFTKLESGKNWGRRRAHGFGEVVEIDGRKAKEVVAAESAYRRHLSFGLGWDSADRQHQMTKDFRELPNQVRVYSSAL